MFPVAEVRDVDLAFPTDVKALMPPYEEIPREFKNGRTMWNRLFNDKFFHGLANLNVVPKEGVDPQKALRHLYTLSGSWEPKHEHKEAGFAYLCSQWFEESTTWERAPKKAS